LAKDHQEQAFGDVVRLCLDEPLYGSIAKITDDHGNEWTQRLLERGYLQFDCFCTFCEKPSTFRTERVNNHNQYLEAATQGRILENDVIPLHMHCQRDNNHIYTYIFEAHDRIVEKIGQNPSMESIARSDLQRFRPILGQGYFAELHRAGGLISHGIGIGSFVYLRRVFERLIAVHRKEFEDEHGVVEGFDGLRMDEKIEALKSALPRALVQNRAVYGILSKGVHELDEETCKRYFPIVRGAILTILEADYQAREKERADKELTEAIAKLAGEIKSV
jgi:hypothetical protein